MMLNKDEITIALAKKIMTLILRLTNSFDFMNELMNWRGILVILVIHQIWVEKIEKLRSMCFWHISDMV